MTSVAMAWAPLLQTPSAFRVMSMAAWPALWVSSLVMLNPFGGLADPLIGLRFRAIALKTPLPASTIVIVQRTKCNGVIALCRGWPRGDLTVLQARPL